MKINGFVCGFLKIGLPAILSFFVFMPGASAQGNDWSISGANYARYYRFEKTKADSAATRFQFDLNLGGFYAGAWLEAKHVESPNRSVDSITQRYFGWENGGLNIHAGNFYHIFDRGLILNAYRDDDVGIDIPLDGFRITGRYDLFDFDAMTATNRSGFDPRPILRGARLKTKPFDFFHIGGGYVKLIESGIGFDDIRSNLDEVNARVNYKYFDGYVEYARRDGYYLEISGDSTIIRDRDGDGLYSSLTANYWKLSALFEYKNYFNLIDPYVITTIKLNQPPAANHQERSLSSQYNVSGERGWRFVLNYSPDYYWFFAVDYAEARSRQLGRKDYFIGELFLEAKGVYLDDNQFAISFDRLKHWERNELTPKLEITYGLGDFKAFTLTAYLNKYINYELRELVGDTTDYTEKYISLDYSHSEKLVFTIGNSWSDKKWGADPNKDPSQMGFAETTLKFPNHDLTLFYGGQRGGFVCAGGICTYRPTFRGLRVILLSRF